MFDRNFVFQDVAYQQLTSSGVMNATYTAKQPGYAYIYVSNEEGTLRDVYIDDVTITQTQSPVVQSEDFYPFGLSFNSYSRENSLVNKYQYNGKELQNDLSLGVYDYGARMYDPTIARWTTIDPIASKYASYSPYNYVLNNPVKLTDSDGRIVRDRDGNVVFSAVETVKVTHPSGSSAVMVRGYIYANDGTKIEAYQKVSGGKGWDTDCHGQTFADGQYWINNDQVRKILKGDKYAKVEQGKEKNGDAVIYTDTNGEVEDSKTVSKTNTDEGTCVYGQGGLQEENTEEQMEKAWCRPDGNTNKEIYRKTQSDVKVSCEQADKMTKQTVQDFLKAAEAAGVKITYK